MKAFHFSLEAVRTLRMRQENDALEHYARALLVRQQALDAVESAREAIQGHWAEMRRQLSRRCAAVQASQLQDHHRVLERRQQECVVALRAAERGVNAASQAMLAARQQREIVDTYRDKQWAKHQRLEARAEQTINDELAARRVTSYQPSLSVL
jgi:flagellar export protein FliJ